MSDFRDIQHGVNDPVDGVDVKRQINTNQTPHERAQMCAPIRRPRRQNHSCLKGCGAGRLIR